MFGGNGEGVALVDPGLDIHLVHLGTMGVYGYVGTDAPVLAGRLRGGIGNQWQLQTYLAIRFLREDDRGVYISDNVTSQVTIILRNGRYLLAINT